MDDYLVWLIFIASGVVAFTIIQLKENKYQRLRKNHQLLETTFSAMQEERKRAEFSTVEMKRSQVSSQRWKEQLQEIKSELRLAKMAERYLSVKRLEHLEKYVATCVLCGDPDLVFLETFDPLAVYTLKERLVRMLDEAEFEVEIVSPWIKRQTWDSIKIPMARFISKGGSLKVFIKDDESELLNGFGDDIRDEVERMGGEVILVKQLHAKLYLVDRKEAIVTSANLTRGGVESNLEAGVWSNNPILIREICRFVDNLYKKPQG
jgi:phosphatidylserine/phosphatidylglycerophosphate/cardiolipin synthase-like enzyme